MLVADVAAGPVEIPNGGLISLARFPEEADLRWTAGYRYKPEVQGRFIRNRSLVSGFSGANLGTGTVAEEIEVTPWMLEVEHRYSSFVKDSESADMAMRLLEAQTGRLLERELWTGEIAQEDDLPNNYLTKSPEDITGTFNPQQAVAALVGEMADAGMGDVLIHVPRQLGVLLPDGWRNETTLEQHGFAVVSGRGYPNTGKIYATDVVNIRLTDPEVLQTDGSQFDLATNEFTYYAQRIGAVDFAGPVFSCTVTL